MMKKYYPWEKNEQGFLIGLTLLALFGLFYLFSSFAFPIIFAIIMTCSTYPIYELIRDKLNSPALASGIMISLLSFLVVFPVVYLFSVSATTIFDLYTNNQSFFADLNFEKLHELKDQALNYLPLSESSIALISGEIDKNTILVYEKAKGFAINISKGFIDNSLSTVVFILLTLFSMFFFYIGGEKIIEKIKIITPLNDDFDHLLLMELYSLCGILTVSIFSIALMQGISFGVVTYFMEDINWFFIAVAIAVCSFIPVIGSLLIWIPLAIYLFVLDQTIAAIIVLIWGSVVNGFIIDNLMRPWMIRKICDVFNKNTSCDLSDFNPLGNTLIVILSTLGGLVHFEVIGLFLGPIIAAISLTIFDIYILRIKAAVNDGSEEDGSEDEYNEPMNGDYDSEEDDNEKEDNEPMNGDYDNVNEVKSKELN